MIRLDLPRVKNDRHHYFFRRLKMKKVYLLAIIVAITLGVSSALIEADFILCTAGDCDGSDQSDVMVAQGPTAVLHGLMGDDVLFDGDGAESIFGDEGNDILFGGRGSESSFGQEGNNTFLPGPDDNLDVQNVFGSTGNDTFLIFAGDTVNCTQLFDDGGIDVANLIGFGPYSAISPFGPEFIESGSGIVIQDPVAGGLIFIRVATEGTGNIEIINGLISPNVTILTDQEFQQRKSDDCIED
jgi:hypothetical protein